MFACLRKRVVIPLLFLAFNSVSAHAFLLASPPEPTIESILDAQESGSWSTLNLSDLLGASWNVSGTTLSFNLVAEYGSFNWFQTLSLVDGSSSKTIFEGFDAPNKSSSYTLINDLTNFEFKTNFCLPGACVVEMNKFKVYMSPTKALYALAYDDNPSHVDYNDMVVTFKVKTTSVPTPVPEPETVAMLLAGLGLINMRIRNRRSSNV